MIHYYINAGSKRIVRLLGEEAPLSEVRAEDFTGCK